jgi:hypothetical protein
MAQCAATAVAMVNSPAEEVHRTLLDYRETRPQLLTDEFGEYEVRAGGTGAGTEVRWTLALDRALRAKKGGKPKKKIKHPPWDCLVQVEEAPDELRIVERDTRSALVTTWTLQPSADGRTAVRVHATWQGPDGLGKLTSRLREQLAVRTVYEGVLTNLHHFFEELS